MPLKRHVVDNVLAPSEVFYSTNKDESINLLVVEGTMDQQSFGGETRFRGKIFIQCEYILRTMQYECI